MSGKPQTGRADSALFLCYLNSIRSPMAEGLARQMYPDMRIASCGLAAGELDDLMVAVMNERGIDMSAHESRTLDEIEQPFDVAIALTPEAADIARRYFADSPTRVESWELPDPTRFYYDVRQMMNDYRAVRDNIEMRLERRFGASRRIS